MPSLRAGDDRAADFLPRAEAVNESLGAVFAFTGVFGFGGAASDLLFDTSPVAQQVFGGDFAAFGMGFESGGADGLVKAAEFDLHAVIVDAGDAVEFAARGGFAQLPGGAAARRMAAMISSRSMVIANNKRKYGCGQVLFGRLRLLLSWACGRCASHC